MLTCYISYTAFKSLTASWRTDVRLFKSFLDVIGSNASKVVIITSDRETAVNDIELFDLLFSLYGDRHPKIISDVEFEAMEINLFNHGRSLVVYSFTGTKRPSIKESGVLHAYADDTAAIKTVFESLTFIDTWKPEGESFVFKRIPQLPVLSIYYQQPYLGADKKRIVSDVNRVIRGIIENDPGIFINSECLLTLIYSKKRDLTDKELTQLNDRIKTEICEPILKRCNIKIKVDFCKGWDDTHARLLLSDYFVCSADHEFTKNVPIDFVTYLRNRNKYKLAYSEIAKRVGGEKKIRIVAP